jgi:DNA-binding protein Fis
MATRLTTEAPEKAAPRIPRRPTNEAQYRIRQCIQKLMDEGYDYEAAQTIFRTYMIDTALKAAKGVKTHAAKTLGITRDHVRDYHARGKDLL